MSSVISSLEMDGKRQQTTTESRENQYRARAHAAH